MKVVYFTDGSRPYGGFTASYTSSEDAGNSRCCEPVSPSTWQVTCGCCQQQRSHPCSPQRSSLHLDSSSRKPKQTAQKQKTKTSSFGKKAAIVNQKSLKKMLLEELLAEFHAVSPLQTTASPTALDQFSVLKKARNLLEGSLLPEGN